MAMGASGNVSHVLNGRMLLDECYGDGFRGIWTTWAGRRRFKFLAFRIALCCLWRVRLPFRVQG